VDALSMLAVTKTDNTKSIFKKSTKHLRFCSLANRLAASYAEPVVALAKAGSTEHLSTDARSSDEF
jgi:hypothetical protein